uniref:UDP-N-acetylglucosamine transferase subunit ALG13 n=2 Tax=Triatominae TaxID=70999 RepID=A0A0V0GCK8_TRIDM
MLNIFVTVGTTKFDKFIRAITDIECIKVLEKRGCQHLTLQIGNGDYIPEYSKVGSVSIEYYRFKDTIKEDLQRADLVISHAGAGSCLETLELEKALLVVVNEDLMNNHQIEVAKKLSDCGYLYYTTCGKLSETLRVMDLSRLRMYPKRDPCKYANAIDNIMGFRRV